MIDNDENTVRRKHLGGGGVEVIMCIMKFLRVNETNYM